MDLPLSAAQERHTHDCPHPAMAPRWREFTAQPKTTDETPPIVIMQDIRWLQIAVHNPVPMDESHSQNNVPDTSALSRWVSKRT
jgi:hypothetical protein